MESEKDSEAQPAYSKMVKVREIGRGTYGIVYGAKLGTGKLNRRDPATLAVKRNTVDEETDIGSGSLRELDILGKMKGHPNHVYLLNAVFGDPFEGGGGKMSPLTDKSVKDDTIHFVFEMAKCDLLQFMMDPNTSYEDLKLAMVHMLVGIEYMHAKKIIHRDLKPPNILVYLDPHGNLCVQICDYGLAKPESNLGPNSPRVVTSWYRAPEVCFQNPNYDTKSDMWSFGCILYEMVAGRPLIQDQKDSDPLLISSILRALPYPVTPKTVARMNVKKMKINHTQIPKRRTWRERFNLTADKIRRFNQADGTSLEMFEDLLDGLLAFDPAVRYSATEALSHPFFAPYQEYIDSARANYPPEEDEPEQILMTPCIERRRAWEVANSYFQDRKNNPWHKDRIIFQSLRLFDRYLIYLETNEMATRPTETNLRGRYHTMQDAKLRYLVCLYIAIKYFSTLNTGIPFAEMVDRRYRNQKSYKIAELFEVTMIRDVLNYRIYEDTVYEVVDDAGELLDEEVVSDLLRIYGEVDTFSGMTSHDIYSLYKMSFY